VGNSSGAIAWAAETVREASPVLVVEAIVVGIEVAGKVAGRLQVCSLGIEEGDRESSKSGRLKEARWLAPQQIEDSN